MKKLLVTLILISLILSPSAMAQADEKLNIVAMNFAAFDFARQIAGQMAEVNLLLPPGVDAHSYEPSPKDLIAIQNADLLVYNGGIGENWITGLLASMENQAPESVAMMDVVDTVTEEMVEGMEDAPHAHGAHEEHDHDGEHEHEHEEEHGHDDEHDHHEEHELDEHVWTTPKNAVKITQAIAEKLTGLDPDNRAVYEENYDTFKKQMEELDQDYRSMLASAKRHTIVLGDRFPMRYFTMEYGLEYYAAFPGCTAQSEPSAKTIAFLMDTIRDSKIPVVFYTEFASRKAAVLIAQETGSKPLLLHSAHNVTTEEMEGGITYLSIMRNNLENLREALN